MPPYQLSACTRALQGVPRTGPAGDFECSLNRLNASESECQRGPSEPAQNAFSFVCDVCAPLSSALFRELSARTCVLMCKPIPSPWQEDSYRGRAAVAGALPPWLKGTLFRAGPGLWEVGERQLRHLSDGFAVIGTVAFRGDGSGGVLAHQRFVDNEPYRAARRGSLIVDKFASRRRFEGWGAWAQDRIRVRGSRFSEITAVCTGTHRWRDTRQSSRGSNEAISGTLN